MSAALKKVPQVAPRQPQVSQQLSLHSRLTQAKLKIREDLMRFRTCCADPRASK